MNIAVLGAGGVGSAAARFLAREGHLVRVFEQFELDHDQGSSFGASRIIRKTYPDRLYTQLMQAAYPLWDELEHEAGERLFCKSGGIYFGTPDHPDLRGIEDALMSNHVVFERLNAEEAHARFPGMRLRPHEIAIFQADSGFLNASKCVQAQARLAQKHGAEIKTQTKVQRLLPETGSIRIETDQGDFQAERLLICAGPWLSRFHPQAAAHLKVTRQQYVYLKIARNPQHFVPGRFPVWIEAALRTPGVAGQHGDMYGFPSDGTIAGVKFALHGLGPVVNPELVPRELDPEYARQLLAFANERMPDLAPEIVHSKTCLYTNTPDEHFLIDALLGLPGAFYIGGLSGHGFKFTVLLGRIGADLVTGKTPPYDLGRFKFARLK